ncbi:MAG: hypothetical protein L0322_32535 [Chloroflexi bacterium]|nr:hypothetical protein [Chloroflexota bacterium]MCI0644911.1 hypothetical protein [Chloroflexota bacterium]
MEKIISEFKIVETEDGFRIEIKGDKEAIRRILRGFDPESFFGGEAPFGKGFRFGFGPGFWSGFSGWCGPWGERGKQKKA